jgi:hypothetical protein
VWEVEATLKKGKRHIYAKRVFYSDEDTWIIVLADAYDGRGNLWRPRVALSKNCYDIPAIVQGPHIVYDLQTDSYAFQFIVNDFKGKYYVFDKIRPDSFFTPENLRVEGRR